MCIHEWVSVPAYTHTGTQDNKSLEHGLPGLKPRRARWMRTAGTLATWGVHGLPEMGSSFMNLVSCCPAELGTSPDRSSHFPT